MQPMQTMQGNAGFVYDAMPTHTTLVLENHVLTNMRTSKSPAIRNEQLEMSTSNNYR